MIKSDFLQIAFYFFFLLLFIKPLGWYMAKVYQGRSILLTQWLKPFELFIYKIGRIEPRQEMDWKNYLFSMLFLNAMSILVLYLIQRAQFYLPLNPQNATAPSPDRAFNTAVSFATNTNWQAYKGDSSLSYLTQMLGLTVQNFISASTGMALLIALIRGITQQERNYLGNFWVDFVRGILYILLPLSLILALLLTSQGVIQNFKPSQKSTLINPFNAPQSSTKITEQILPMGPVASQVAIKQLGSNGGGFFNTNSAHPFENPTPCTNFLEMMALLLIPAALCFTFGIMVHDKRQGWAIFIAMFLLFFPMLILELYAEHLGNPALNQLGIDNQAKPGLYSAGNMEGKEVRFGITSSALWVTATTASSNGSVNTMLDSLTPLGSFVPLWLMHLGEISFGGVGSGLYGMLMLILITVFITGLMVGRSPEYMGKKIEPYEIKMASIAVLVMPLTALISTAYAVITPQGIEAILNPGAQGFTEILYAFTSMGNNNGSAFAGLNNTPFYNIVGGLVMLISRYWIAIPVLAIAGSLVKKKHIPSSLGTLTTHTPLFILLLVCISTVLGALSFLPSLALGPIVEHVTLWSTYGH